MMGKILEGSRVFSKSTFNPQTAVTKFLASFGLCCIVLSSTSPSMACEDYTDSGITLICQYRDQLVTWTNHSIYKTGEDIRFVSDDGGKTWGQAVFDRGDIRLINCPEINAAKFVSDGQNIQYRWKIGAAIERSGDEGKTWTLDYDLSEKFHGIDEYYYGLATDRFCGRQVKIEQGPMSGFYDSKTGNIVFSMGWQGVLLRTANGDYQWVPIGADYQLNQTHDLKKIFFALFFDIWLALSLLFLIFATLASSWRRTQTLFVMVAWVSWIFLSHYLMNRGKNWPYWDTNGKREDILFLFVFLFLMALALFIKSWRKLNSQRLATTILGMSLISPLAFLLPLLLWTQGIIENFQTAHLNGWGLVVVILMIIVVPIRRHLFRTHPSLDPHA